MTLPTAENLIEYQFCYKAECYKEKEKKIGVKNTQNQTFDSLNLKKWQHSKRSK